MGRIIVSHTGVIITCTSVNGVAYQHSCLFQMPVEYGGLKVAREHRIQAGDEIVGMCHYRGRLYTIEFRREAWSYRLAVYSVNDKDTVTLLDVLDMLGDAREPRIDRRSGQVYVPCETRGVSIVRYDGSKLVPVTSLRCVGKVASLAVIPCTSTLYVSDRENYAVSIVDVDQDRVTKIVHGLKEVRGDSPNHIAVLGDTVLLVYEDEHLVIYQHNVPSSGKVIPWPQGLRSVWSLTTDDHFSFLLTCSDSHTIYVLDFAGNLTHTIPIPGDREPRACTVMGGQLWVGCDNGDIVMSSSH